MAKEKTRLGLVFRPDQQERGVPFGARVRFAMLGANSLTPITAETHPQLNAMLEEISDQAGMATPNAYIWESAKPVANAVAMPSKTPTIAFSKTITEILQPEELAAVAGHELGHVKNMSHSGKLFWLSAFGAGAMADLAARPVQNQLKKQMVTGAVLGRATPVQKAAHSALTVGRFVAPVVGAAIASRSEEYAADRHGAYTMEGNGVPLLSALEKLGQHNTENSKSRPVGLVERVLKPISYITRSHPTFEQRRVALGISQEAIDTYQGDIPGAETPQPNHGEQVPGFASDAAVAPQSNAQEKDWQTRVGDAQSRDTQLQTGR